MTNSQVLEVAAINSGDGDVFGWVQGWRFAIAQRLEDLGEFVPNFRGDDGIRQDFEYEELAYMEQESVDDLVYALKILDRYRAWVGLAGKDY